MKLSELRLVGPGIESRHRHGLRLLEYHKGLRGLSSVCSGSSSAMRKRQSQCLSFSKMEHSSQSISSAKRIMVSSAFL